jgi:two-component system, NarL family, response regulator EvgA
MGDLTIRIVLFRMPRTVVIVDDHAQVRTAVRAVAEAAGLVVVGEAADGQAALDAVNVLAPDVVLLDFELPGEDGIAVAKRLAGLQRPPTVILMSGSPAASLGERLARAPIRAFIPKERLTPRTLADLLR